LDLSDQDEAGLGGESKDSGPESVVAQGIPMYKTLLLKRRYGMAKVAITCNGAEAGNVFSPFILGSAAAASGDEVVLFFTPGGAPALVKGKLEEMREVKGLPDLLELYDGVQSLGGKVYVCELALEAKGLMEEDFREGVEVVGATTFLNEIKDATITFSF